MLMSEILGVERDVDFGVKGYSVIFKITTHLAEYEYLQYKCPAGLDWREADGTMLCIILSGAPANIIHLPPPPTDEQREQLKALWTLGYRWIAKDSDGIVYSYGNSKPEKWRYHWVAGCVEMDRIHEQMPESIVKSLVSWPDPEPYDIGKALGVEE